MKKLLVLSLSVVMVIAFASISMAKTMDVNVDKEVTISIDHDYKDSNYKPVTITGNFGVSDKLELDAGYTSSTIDSSSDYYTLGGRYEIINNMAVGFNYKNDRDLGCDNEAWTVDLRGKLPLSKQLALTGLAGYTKDRADDVVESYNVIAQAEYAITDTFIPTLAFNFTDYDNDDDCDRYAVIGMDIYPLDNFFIYADYNINVNDSDSNYVYFGLEYKLK